MDCFLRINGLEITKIVPVSAGMAMFIIQIVVLAAAATSSLFLVEPRNSMAKDIFTPMSITAGKGIMLPTKKIQATALAACKIARLHPNA